MGGARPQRPARERRLIAIGFLLCALAGVAVIAVIVIEEIGQIRDVERGIEDALPLDRDVAPEAQPPGPAKHLVRIEPMAAAEGEPRFRLTLGARAWETGAPGADADEAAWDAWDEGLDPLLTDLRAAIREAAKGDSDPVGEIWMPRPGELTVPHGLVIRVLSTFLEAGVTNVEFTGAPLDPLAPR